MLEKYLKGEDPFANETVDPEMEGEDGLRGEEKEGTPEEVAAEVLAEVITAAVRAAEGEGGPAAEVLTEAKSPASTEEAGGSLHPEQPLEEQPCAAAPESRDSGGEARSEAAGADGEAAVPAAEARSTAVAAIPGIMEAEAGQTEDAPAQ